MKFAATLVAAAIASTAVALNAKPAKASTEYQQLFAYCLQQSGGHMDFCHSWTRCVFRNGTFMGQVCTTSARNYIMTGFELF